MNIGERGKTGEDKVAEFLRRRGYIVVRRNYQCRFGEIDIISENEDYIVFTEVKTRAEDALVSGEESVDAAKIRRIRLTAFDYMRKISGNLRPRFDVASVTVYRKDDGSDGYRLHYLKNAFG